MTERMRLQE